MSDLLHLSAEALALHLDGEGIPEARSLDEVRLDPEVSQDLADGAA